MNKQLKKFTPTIVLLSALIFVFLGFHSADGYLAKEGNKLPACTAEIHFVGCAIDGNYNCTLYRVQGGLQSYGVCTVSVLNGKGSGGTTVPDVLQGLFYWSVTGPANFTTCNFMVVSGETTYVETVCTDCGQDSKKPNN